MADAKAMSQLFACSAAISKHLKNIFNEGEPDEKVVVSILEITTQHGAIEWKTQIQGTQFYNLDAIFQLSVISKATIFAFGLPKC